MYVTFFVIEFPLFYLYYILQAVAANFTYEVSLVLYIPYIFYFLFLIARRKYSHIGTVFVNLDHTDAPGTHHWDVEPIAPMVGGPLIWAGSRLVWVLDTELLVLTWAFINEFIGNTYTYFSIIL